MREFFKDWRRKAGCVALVMALLFTAAWIRTQATTDALWVNDNGTHHCAHSFDGRICWFRFMPKNESSAAMPGNRVVNWKCYDRSKRFETEVFIEPFVDVRDASIWKWGGFYFGSADRVGGRTLVWNVPYWSICVPFTLLSTYLILWKPRKKEPRDA